MPLEIATPKIYVAETSAYATRPMKKMPHGDGTTSCLAAPPRPSCLIDRGRAGGILLLDEETGLGFAPIASSAASLASASMSTRAEVDST